ncbi:MAG TPA: Crp/Fnr family transcriptional regulator [Sphingomonas sp.]
MDVVNLQRAMDSEPVAAQASTGTGAARATCSDCAARNHSICASLDDAELRTLHRIGRRRHVARGETVCWAGEDGGACANILSGMFKLSAMTADGREQIVGLLYPSDFVGRPYASQTEFTVTALSDAELCFFPRTDFEGALALHGALSRALLHRTLETLDNARRRMLLLGRQSAEERVAGFLLDMAAQPGACRASGARGPVTFDLPLSRGAMADVLGLTIETVSRQMSKFKAAGIIALPGGRAVTISRRDELEAIVAAV